MTATGGTADSPIALPFWARPSGVVFFAGLWTGAFLFIATILRSNIGNDDALEVYQSQSLELFYRARNPALYDWMLYGLNGTTGSPFVSVAILNYASILACALLLYRLARHVLADPRLQALSVYSLALLWVVAYDSHRILTHTNLNIVVIAATLLTLHALGRKRTVAGYLLLGLLFVVGMLAKYAYGVFFGALVAAALLESHYRRVILDPRFLLTLLVAATPFAVLASLYADELRTIATTVDGVVQTGTQAPFIDKLAALAAALVGYLLPFLVVYGGAFFLRDTAPPSPHRPGDPFLRLLGIMLLIAMFAMIVWAFVVGSTQLRSRYMHGVWLPAPLFFMMLLDRTAHPPRAFRSFLTATAVITGVVVAIYVGSRLAPSEALCGSCRPSIPYQQLGDALEARYGPSPTLVGYSAVDAGYLRAAVPGARTLPLEEHPYRPPARGGGDCLLVWEATSRGQDRLADAMAGRGLPLLPDEELTVDWWAPLLPYTRQTSFLIQRLSPDSALCE
ncbi:glycosyltransferase family 39 protein [Aquibium microcysteis]|uniref:glycosyltransferase family 39 protein n=1 Tax=Aquibium microcysteis TaxID=675281 RepID=UPI00165CF8CB|nr:glycosyltransferase family 39 protein [Aquibium microcysteis]